MIRIGRGQATSFWNDKWVDGGPLINHITGLVHDEEKELRVSDVLADEKWNLQQLQTPILDDVKTCILGVLTSVDRQMKDRITWHHSQSGTFTVRSAYNMLSIPELLPADK